MGKSVLMPYKAFLALVRLLYGDESEDDRQMLLQWVETKATTLARHDQYGKWKNARLNAEERESARRRYAELTELDAMQEDFLLDNDETRA